MLFSTFINLLIKAFLKNLFVFVSGDDQNAYFRSSDALSHGAVLNSRDLISAVEETKADDLDSSNASDGPWLAGKDSTESFRPEHRPLSQLGVTCIFYDENRQLRS